MSVRDLRLAVLAITAAGALLASVFLLSVALGPSPATRPTSPAVTADVAERLAQIEPVIAATLGVAPFFERLRDLAPADYDAALRRAAATPAGAPTDGPDHWLSDAIKIVRQTHGSLAAKAGAEPLGRIFERQAAVLAALGKGEPRLCVDFLYGGASDGFFRFAAANRDLVGDLALAGLDAIADGQAKKIDRSPPSDGDFQALEAALREKGLDAVEITALLDGKAPEPPLPDTRMCEIGNVYLDVLANLPEDARLRLYALAVALMARS